MIYLVKCGEFYKIGYTSARNADGRIAGMRTGNPYPITVVELWEGDRKAEEALHTAFAYRRTSGEWFALTDEDLARLRREMAAYVPDEKQPARRAAPPDPLCLPDLKFPPGIDVEVHGVGCTWCARWMRFVGEINYLICECGMKSPMGTIVCNRERRKAVEAVMFKHCVP